MTTDPPAIERSLRRRIYVLGFSSFLFFILLAIASTRQLITLHMRTRDSVLRLYCAGNGCIVSSLMLNTRKKLRIILTDFTKPPGAEEQKQLRRSIDP